MRSLGVMLSSAVVATGVVGACSSGRVDTSGSGAGFDASGEAAFMDTTMPEAAVEAAAEASPEASAEAGRDA